MNMMNRIVQVLIILVAYGAVPAWGADLNRIKGPITAAKVFTQTEIKSFEGKDGLEKVLLWGPSMDRAYEEKYRSYSMLTSGSFQECYDSSFGDVKLMMHSVPIEEEWRFFDKAEIEGKNYANTYTRYSTDLHESVEVNLSVEDLKRLVGKELFDVNVSGKWDTKTIKLHGAYVEGFLKTINQCAVLYKNRPKK